MPCLSPPCARATDVRRERAAAEEHFYHFSPIFEIGSEIDFVCAEANRLRLRYPKVLVAPMLYKVEDNRLYLIEE